MKLVRYGRPGKEKPGLIDAAGKIRDLSEVVADIDAATLAPRVAGPPRQDQAGEPAGGSRRAAHRPVRRQCRQFHRRRAQLRRPRGRIGHADPQGAGAVQQGAHLRRRPLRRRRDPAGLGKDRLGGRARRRHRRARQLRPGQGRARPSSPAIASSTTSPSAPTSCERGGGQWTKGKGCPTFGPIGPWLVTTDEIADPQELAMWLDVNGERMQSGSTATMIFGVAKLVVRNLAVHDPRTRRRHHHRHAARRRLGQEAAALSQGRRHGFARRRRPRPAGAARRRLVEAGLRRAADARGALVVSAWGWRRSTPPPSSPPTGCGRRSPARSCPTSG